jgi:hypothetical protein
VRVDGANLRDSLIRLWQLVGVLTIATTVFFAFLTGVTATPADLIFFFEALFALITPPVLMLACLHAGQTRLAAYSAIPGVLISAGACCFMLLGFFVPLAGLAQIPMCALGIAFALPYGYASVLQLKVAATISAGNSRRRVGLGRGEDNLLLTP